MSRYPAHIYMTSLSFLKHFVSDIRKHEQASLFICYKLCEPSHNISFHLLSWFTLNLRILFSALPVMVENVSKKILEHITEQCLVCCDVGVPCNARQACEDPSSLIFPFQVSHTLIHNLPHYNFRWVLPLNFPLREILFNHRCFAVKKYDLWEEYIQNQFDLFIFIWKCRNQSLWIVSTSFCCVVCQEAQVLVYFEVLPAYQKQKMTPQLFLFLRSLKPSWL